MGCDCGATNATTATNFSLVCNITCNSSLEDLMSTGLGDESDRDYRGPLYLALIRSIFLFFVEIMAIFGNLLVIIAVYRNYALQTVAAVFMVNLAIADIAVGVVCMPFAAVTSLYGEWIFGMPMCVFNGAMNTFFCVTSMLTLSTIALDRYFAIVQALHYHQKMNKNTVTVLIVWAWTQPLIVCLLPVVGWSHYTYIPNEFVCSGAWEVEKSYTLVASLTCFGVPLLIMAFAYISIFKVAWEQGKKIAAMDVTKRNEGKGKKGPSVTKKTILIPSTIIGTFMILWLPHMAGMVCLTFGNCTWPDWFFATSTWLGYTNSACNPVIYAALDRRFRTAMFKIACGRFRKEDDRNGFSTSVK